MSDVQGLVDALAVELDRPVGVDDRQFRAIAYSSHDESVDQVRLASILHRQAPAEVVAWLESLGVRHAERAVRVPANASFGMSARVCVPVRFDGTLLGFLWLIDEPGRLTESQLEESVRYAEELAVALYRLRILEQDHRERERELVAQALGRGGGTPEVAAAELVSGGYLAAAPAYLALVMRAYHPSGEQMSDPIRVRLADAGEQLRRTMAPHHMLVLAVGDEVVAVLAATSADEATRRAESLAAAAEQSLAGYPEWDVRIGVGEECETLSALARSYRQARDAVLVARALERPEPFVRWADLGAYRTIVGLAGDRDVTEHIPQSLRELLAADDATTLMRTLECYLDLGADARAAAEALYVHRSSLYGRLHRIEEIAGVDLRSGEDRLQLHLGLRLLRLSGGLEQ